MADLEGDDTGESGGVGRAWVNVANSGSGSWMVGMSVLGLDLRGVNFGKMKSLSLGRDGGGECSLGICWNGRKSEEPVLLDLSRGRLGSRLEL